MEDLKKLSLQELKIVSSEYKLNRTGTRSELIKRIWALAKPEPITINNHPASLTPSGRKVVGVKLSDSEKQKQIGAQREKGNIIMLYYSMGVHYYEVNTNFQFV